MELSLIYTLSFIFPQKSIFLECETQIESLLAKVFENYKSLDEDSPTGIRDLFGPISDSAAPALAPAVQVYTILHDILTLDAQAMLKNYLQVLLQCEFMGHNKLALQNLWFLSCNFDYCDSSI